MIYLFQELDLISNELLHQIIFSMPVARREYVLHFKQPEDQKRSALAWLLLRYGLKQEYGFREVPDFQRTTSGKPFFRGENMPFFNLSHSGNFVGCAVPLWWSWDSYQEMAASSGFDANTLNMQFSMVTSPALMLLGVAITAVLAILGTLFGQRLLRKHFQKAGIVG